MLQWPSLLQVSAARRLSSWNRARATTIGPSTLDFGFRVRAVRVGVPKLTRCWHDYLCQMCCDARYFCTDRQPAACWWGLGRGTLFGEPVCQSCVGVACWHCSVLLCHRCRVRKVPVNRSSTAETISVQSVGSWPGCPEMVCRCD